MRRVSTAVLCIVNLAQYIPKVPREKAPDYLVGVAFRAGFVSVGTLSLSLVLFATSSPDTCFQLLQL